MTGVPIAPKATGAVFAIRQRPDACKRRKADPDQDRAGHRYGCAETGGSFKKRTEGERDQEELQAAIFRDVGDAVLQDLEVPFFNVSW